MNFFENFAIVSMQIDNVTLYAYEILKVTSGINLKKAIFFTGWHHHPKNSKYNRYILNTNNSNTLTLSGPPGHGGVSREAKLTTEFEFGSLVH